MSVLQKGLCGVQGIRDEICEVTAMLARVDMGKMDVQSVGSTLMRKINFLLSWSLQFSGKGGREVDE
jgi:hypothetical protein